jgi:hypothetical protein
MPWDASPLVSRILTLDLGRIDALGFGLDGDVSSQLLDKAGKAANRLHAIGLALRAAFEGITAIPDARPQIAPLITAVTSACSLGLNECPASPS